MLHVKTVEPNTFSVLNQLMEIPELQDFSLVGGTSLSLYYGNRKSVDPDLFSNKPFENNLIVESLKKNFRDKFLMEEKPQRFGIFCYLNAVKADLIRHPHPLIRPQLNKNGIRIFSVEDIIAMKVQAI